MTGGRGEEKRDVPGAPLKILLRTKEHEIKDLTVTNTKKLLLSNDKKKQTVQYLIERICKCRDVSAIANSPICQAVRDFRGSE